MTTSQKKVTPARRVFAAGVSLALLLVLVGCTPAEEQTVSDVEIYFVGDTPQGFRLFSERHSLDISGANPAEEVLQKLVSGEIQPSDPDYVNLWDSSHTLRGLQIEGGIATVDLDLGVLNVGAESEQRAIDQLVWTLTGIDTTVTEVFLLVDGMSVESLAGHVDASGGFTRGDGLDALSPVQIVHPQHGEEVTLPVTITGEACTFEANVVWSLNRKDVVIDEGFTTAESACPDRSAWTVELGELETGSYTFVAQEFSAEDGRLLGDDTKSFTVR